MLKKKNKDLFCVSIILFVAFILTAVSFSVDLNNRLSNFVYPYLSLPPTKFILNFGFLCIASFLFIFYRRYKLSEAKKKELENIIESINPYMLMTVDSDMKITMCNGSVKKLLGYEADEVMNNKTVSFLLNNNENDIFEKIKQKDFYIGEVTGKRKSGKLVSLELIATPLKNQSGAVFLLRDITAHKISQDELLSLKKAVENMQIGVTITDTKGQILYTNAADAEMHGYEQEELIGKDVRIFALPERYNPMSEQQLKSLKRFRRESINVKKDGSVFPVHLMSDIVTNKEGEIIGVITTCEDISERKKQEELIKHIAYYDSLTGLPNRTLFIDLLKRELAKAKRHKKSFAILFIDLDRFKVINDTLGHTMGDLLLHTIANRLKNVLRESDTVSRLSGDEFIILIPDITDIQDVSVITDKIIKKVSEVYVLSGKEIYITASIGISIFPDHGRDIESLIKNADTAMYHAKEHGKNCYQFYKSSINPNASKKFSMETQLRKAFERNEFVLHYQPQIDLNTGKVIGAEALLRWQNGDKLIRPKRFIPLAEEIGLIVPIGEWVFRTVCNQNKAWQDMGLPPICTSVNVSMNQFKERTFIKNLTHILDETELNPEYLELELTESIIMYDTELTASVIHQLKALGVRFSIDDFGTGYSSLSYLKLLPLDKVKIDQSFIRAIGVDTKDEAIIQAIIMVAQKLNLEVIAEGVENNTQLSFLHSLNCDCAQGFLFSKPLPAEDFLKQMKLNKEKSITHTTHETS